MIIVLDITRTSIISNGNSHSNISHHCSNSPFSMGITVVETVDRSHKTITSIGLTKEIIVIMEAGAGNHLPNPTNHLPNHVGNRLPTSSTNTNLNSSLQDRVIISNNLIITNILLEVTHNNNKHGGRDKDKQDLV